MKPPRSSGARPSLVVASLFAAASTTCSTTATVNATFNFTRATDVAFLCFSIPAGGSGLNPSEIRPLSDCVLAAADNTPTVNAMFHLHALVTQSERGELAVVDLASTAAISLVDTRSSIPGYTFVPVGPSPSAVVADVRTDGPSAVWVASGGGRSVQRLDPRGLARSVVGEIPLNGAPFDLVIDTVGTHHFLYASVPDRNAVAVINVDDIERPTNLGFVSLSASGDSDAGIDAGAGTQSAARPLGLAVDSATHNLYVSDDASNFVHVLAFPSGTTDALPTEVDRLDVGAPSRTLLVTPAVRAGRSEWCDVSDPDHCAETEYLYTVASSDGAVYAYDLRRRARVRANRLPNANPTNRLVDPTYNSEYRVPLPAAAVSLVSIATSDYVAPGAGTPSIPCEASATCPTTAVNSVPGQLHGLFVGALLRNGLFSLVDLDDYDALCRRNGCSAAANASEATSYRMIRHAPRSAVALSLAPQLAGRPTLTSSVLGGDRTQVTTGLTVPTIACSDARGANTPECTDTNFGVEIVPASGSSVECDAGTDAATDAPVDAPTEDVPADAITDADTDASTDAGTDVAVDAGSTRGPAISSAYVTQNETWSLTFEGTLPGLDLEGGALSAGDDGATLTLSADGAGFCSRGTLSVSDHRDTATLVSDVTPTTGTRLDDCVALFGTAAQPANRDFAISSATQNALTLELPVDLAGDDARNRANRLMVARCFAQATRFQVRATDQWMVTGSRTNFPHAITTNAMGRCVVDEALQRASETRAAACLLTRVPRTCRTALPSCPAGRACLPTVVNGATILARDIPITATAAFCIQVFPGLDLTMPNAARVVRPLRDLQFVFSIGGAYAPLTFPTGMFPSVARFLPAFNRLYVVDQGSTGLLEFRTDPVTRSRLFN